jgi:predicted DNA helicase
MAAVTIEELQEIVERERGMVIREILRSSPTYRARIISLDERLITLHISGGAFFEAGDFISYLLGGKIKNLGTVVDYNSDSGVLTVFLYSKPGLIVGEEILIIESEALIGFELQLELLERIKEGELVHDIVDLIFSEKNLGKLEAGCDPTDNKTVDGRKILDSSQLQAVRRVLCMREGDLLLVVGPPGTGKTEFIAKSAWELQRKGEKVLIASHTNRAVDSAIEKLPLEISLRVGRPEKVLPHLYKYLLSYKARERLGEKLKEIEDKIKERKNTLMELASKHRDSSKYFKRQEDLSRELGELLSMRNTLLEKASKALASEIPIVGSTLIKSQLYPLNTVNFDTVLIDECSQATIPLALLSLVKAKKYVMVGDHRQLLPILRSVRSLEKLEELSSFNFFMRKYGRRVGWLRTHYRSNSKIIGFSQRYVYNGNISTHKRCRQIELKISGKAYENLRDKRKEIADSKKPVVFVNVEGIEERRGGSKCNKKEAEVCADIVGLLTALGVKKEEIGVITPYVEQRALISKKIKKKRGLEINTVDAFQGREKDVIIISITSTGSMRFPSEPHRLNVALTRARRKLIVVGNGGSIYKSQGTLIFKFLEYVYKYGKIYDWEKRKWLN